MNFDLVAHAGVLVDVLLFATCFVILLGGLWIYKNPVGFWDQFNPYLRPYGRLTLALGKVIGSLWAFGAVLGCIVLIGNAIRQSLHHHWIR
ncbi:MAG TPA: hypothetical protein VG498_04400 [Terriglobales bacterium]|nr:hypothetical protein [Terriglobales bacterium]